MCPDRVSAGKPTACAEICPTGATKFGERDELIAEARKRIHDNPGNYVDHIYGLEEVGGTSVLLLSAVPFETFGYRSNLSKDPMPMLTYRVLSHIPDFVPLGGMVLGGIWWITHRREEVALAEGRAPATVESTETKTANKNGRKS
jgi:formate dehydrogenase iron-sulfur subunit